MIYVIFLETSMSSSPSARVSGDSDATQGKETCLSKVMFLKILDALLPPCLHLPLFRTLPGPPSFYREAAALSFRSSGTSRRNLNLRNFLLSCNFDFHVFSTCKLPGKELGAKK